jgi:hypothetical protein
MPDDEKKEAKWNEIFRAGKYPRWPGAGKDDSDEWTDAEVATMAANYDAAWHPAPVVLGHTWTPGTPAAGFVAALRYDGGSLLARIEATNGEAGRRMVDGVKAGEYRAFSIEPVRDYFGKGPYLFRLAVLGGEPPRVPGMMPAQFSCRPPDGFSATAIPPTPFTNRNEDSMEKKDVEKVVDDHLASPPAWQRFKDSLFGAGAKPEQFAAQLDELSKKFDAAQKRNADLEKELSELKAGAKSKEAEQYAALAILDKKLAPAHKDSIVQMFSACGKEQADKFVATLSPVSLHLLKGVPAGTPVGDGGDAFDLYAASAVGQEQITDEAKRNGGNKELAVASIRKLWDGARASA